MYPKLCFSKNKTFSTENWIFFRRSKSQYLYGRVNVMKRDNDEDLAFI